MIAIDPDIESIDAAMQITEHYFVDFFWTFVSILSFLSQLMSFCQQTTVLYGKMQD